MHAEDFTSGQAANEVNTEFKPKPQTFSDEKPIGEYIYEGDKVIFAPGVIVDITNYRGDEDPITAEIIEEGVPDIYIDPDYQGAAYITNKPPKGGLFAFWLKLKSLCSKKMLNEREAKLKEELEMVSAEPPKVVMTSTGVLANIMKFRVDARHENPKGAAKRAAIAFRKEIIAQMAEESPEEYPANAETNET